MHDITSKSSLSESTISKNTMLDEAKGELDKFVNSLENSLENSEDELDIEEDLEDSEDPKDSDNLEDLESIGSDSPQKTNSQERQNAFRQKILQTKLKLFYKLRPSEQAEAIRLLNKINNMAVMEKKLTDYHVESICFLCNRGCSKMCNNSQSSDYCCWHKEGKPRSDWKAKAITYQDIDPEETDPTKKIIRIKSYRVQQCPDFEMDYTRPQEFVDIAPILTLHCAVSLRTLYRNPRKWLKKYNDTYPFAPLRLFNGDLPEEIEKVKK